MAGTDTLARLTRLAPPRARSEASSSASRAFLRELFREYGPRDFAVRLWDGSTLDPTAGEEARFTLVLNHPGSLRAMFWPPTELTLGEAYIYGDFDLEGDVTASFRLADHLLRERHWATRERLKLALDLLRLPADSHRRSRPRPLRLSGSPRSLSRTREAIGYHYDTSNEFFRLWLDRRMVYSCAYFESGEDDLDTAQERKLDYICKKLRLRPGERLLDIGCGWGALLLHAAEHYRVSADGITLSTRQAELARQRVAERRRTADCRVELKDYRELECRAQYDKLVSVGMFEHVGREGLVDYFSRAFALLRPGGIMLNHGIAAPTTSRRRGKSFTTTYLFPDGELVPVHTALAAAEAAGFEIRDVESLREHYALTLRHWLRRLEAHSEEANELVGSLIPRIWRLSWAGATHGFESGRLNLYQVLLVKPERGRSRLPLTRADLYR